MKQRIVAIHLPEEGNRNSASLRQVLETLNIGYDIILYTTAAGSEVTRELEGVKKQIIFYRWHRNGFIAALYLLLSQALLFMRLLVSLRKRDIIYINTLLPFGAALAGYIRGANVVYHLHETSDRYGGMGDFLSGVANTTATRVLAVSHYLASQYQFTNPSIDIIYDCLSAEFISKTRGIKRLNTDKPFTVTMLSSFADYNGVSHFITIARKMPHLDFVLVLDTTQKDVDTLKLLISPPDNCTTYPARQNTARFYENTHVILDLSKTEEWAEPFSITILEALHCGRPVICPPSGGLPEQVTDGVEGYTIDSKREDWICIALNRLAADSELYKELSEACYLKSLRFGRNIYEQQLHNVFAEMRSEIMDVYGIFL